MANSFLESEVVSDPQPEQQSMDLQAEPVALALSADDFSALEERIVRAVELVKRERQLRAAAEDRATKAEVQLGEQAPLVAQLQEEVRSLHAERDHVRQRVDRLLSQLDSLEL
jgi:hypothetical protein